MIQTLLPGLHGGLRGNLIDCQRPSTWCQKSYDVYNNVDCDGDGFLDHACFNTATGRRYLILSSEGCQTNWNWEALRSVSECLPAFRGTL